jgi:hypothetical protein
MFISHLSGSEADQQSQSSAHGSANSDVESSSSESEAEDQVDEFGFRIPTYTEIDTVNEGQSGLVLMENWDGKLVLYQTHPSKPTKTRNRSGSRGSRTNGSVAGSTIAPSASDQLDVGERERDLHLMIDPEAVAAEYDEDATSEEWSGESDEMDGDTTDSMDEEDMPLLDSPAMQELIDQQIRLASPSIADGLLEAPAIVVTDTDVSMGEVRAAPAITTQLPAASVSSATPQTPGGSIIPMMGTFLPTSTDPAQHAVIDGSGMTTKSPFTHRRRSRKNRGDGDNISVSSGGRSIMSRSTVERKRKNSNSASATTDPFGGPPILRTLSKKARYTSIPGHPKYVQAQRIEEGDETSTEEDEEGGEFDLEDMLDPELLEQLAQTGEHPLRPGARIGVHQAEFRRDGKRAVRRDLADQHTGTARPEFEQRDGRAGHAARRGRAGGDIDGSPGYGGQSTGQSSRRRDAASRHVTHLDWHM